MPDTIIRRRLLALLVIRSIAVLLLAVGAYHLVYAIGLVVGERDLNMLWAQWNNGFSFFYHGVATSFVGAGLAVFGRKLVRWVLPLPQHECPQCGYGFKGLTSPRCPECGFGFEHDENSPGDRA